MEYTLENLEVYNAAEAFSDKVWEIVAKFNFFEKDTIGKQIARSADSISANVAEGYGRYYYKESKQFYFYSRGSLLETKSWLGKCKRRKLIDDKLADELIAEADKILAQLNGFIKFISNSAKHNK